jgi:hypothetical protein
MTYRMLRGVLFVAALATFGRAAVGHATPCKADGLSCSSNQSCCGRLCYNSAPPVNARRAYVAPHDVRPAGGAMWNDPERDMRRHRQPHAGLRHLPGR